MKKLEDKILNKVYVFETKKTFMSAMVKIMSVCMLLVATGTFAYMIIQTFIERETMSVIDIFQENMQALHTYILDVAYVILIETPQPHMAFFIIGIVALFITLWVFIRNRSRISNKIRSLVRYWGRKNKQ
ncbi:MAG: hypothetical protein WC775_04365 [Patescibacteria group bacterium]|jgi:hypothetical protein